MAPEPADLEASRSHKAAEILREIGSHARLLVYIASAPGAGKTRRLIDDAQRLRATGKRVAIGWIDTKGRPDLDRLAEGIERIPPRAVRTGDRHNLDFDFEAAVACAPDALVLDELAHENADGAPNAKRWQDALALRERGISVLGAFNVAHLESAAPVAELALGHPIREIIPVSFLRSADETIALDVSPSLLKRRLRSGKIVEVEDIDLALDAAFSDRALHVLRELLLRTIDELTIPAVSAGNVSSAAALVFPGTGIEPFLRRVAALARAQNLALEIFHPRELSPEPFERLAHELDGEVLVADFDMRHLDIGALRASLVALPYGAQAKRLAGRPIDRDLFVVGKTDTIANAPATARSVAFALSDRMRVGYGQLTVYLGAAAGAGKTYAMLDRAQQLRGEGVDVVCGYIETHGRIDTAALLTGLEIVPRAVHTIDGRRYEELDTAAVIARRPAVVLIDELAHTNSPGAAAHKRYEDVLTILRAGIDVITTLNVQHLEALTDAVLRLTGTTVRETLPDELLSLADEVVLIDVSAETLRERMRAGKIYPAERIDAALANFFRPENLNALRELAVREALGAQERAHLPSPFGRLLLTVAPRLGDLAFIERCAKIAQRLHTDFAVVCVRDPRDVTGTSLVERLRERAAYFHGTWIAATAAAMPAAVVDIARQVPHTTIAVGCATRRPRWYERGPFAKRLIDAGAPELLILARRGPAPD